MRLYIYRGLDAEKVSKDATHIIVDVDVTIIKERAFYYCTHLLSVTMRDNIKAIQHEAFYNCHALRFIRLSKTLEYVGTFVFYGCDSLKALFLPWTVKWICYDTFIERLSLKFQNGIDPSNVSNTINKDTIIHHVAVDVVVKYEMDRNGFINAENNRQVNE